MSTTTGGASSEEERRLEIDEEVMKEKLPQDMKQQHGTGSKVQRAQTHKCQSKT